MHTLGAVDPVQMTQMAKHQEIVYVSGWAASSLLTTANNEVAQLVNEFVTHLVKLPENARGCLTQC